MAEPLPTPWSRSPLGHQPAVRSAGDELAIKELPLQGVLVLRGEPDAISAGVEAALGIQLPLMATEMVIGTDAGRCLWISPDEWWIVTPEIGAEEALGSRLQETLAGIHHAVVVVSDYYTSIRVSGTQARTALAKLTPFDVHPRAFPRGQAAATVMAHAQVTLQALPPAEEEVGDTAFEILVRASMADYVYALLAKAGREWGMPAVHPRHVSLSPAAHS